MWALRQFCHFLTLNQLVPENIATALPYPKIEKTVPEFLTADEYNQLIGYFSHQTRDMSGLRNLIIIMLLGMQGTHTATLIALNIEDIDVSCGLIIAMPLGLRL